MNQILTRDPEFVIWKDGAAGSCRTPIKSLLITLKIRQNVHLDVESGKKKEIDLTADNANTKTNLI